MFWRPALLITCKARKVARQAGKECSPCQIFTVGTWEAHNRANQPLDIRQDRTAAQHEASGLLTSQTCHYPNSLVVLVADGRLACIRVHLGLLWWQPAGGAARMLCPEWPPVHQTACTHQIGHDLCSVSQPHSHCLPSMDQHLLHIC